MKSVLLLSPFLLLIGVAFAGEDEWKELEAFHSVMAETFHPAEDGDLKPVRENAGDLVAKAKAWQESPVPAGFDKTLTTKPLKTLVAKCKEVQSAVKAKKSDAELTKLITGAHDAFHEIVEKCRTTEKKDDHKGHNH